jgi:hypothetical protein
LREFRAESVAVPLVSADQVVAGDHGNRLLPQQLKGRPPSAGGLGVSSPVGPVVALYNGMVLVHPGNAEVAEALGSMRPAGLAYDVISVGAGRGRRRPGTASSRPRPRDQLAASPADPAHLAAGITAGLSDHSSLVSVARLFQSAGTATDAVVTYRLVVARREVWSASISRTERARSAACAV